MNLDDYDYKNEAVLITVLEMNLDICTSKYTKLAQNAQCAYLMLKVVISENVLLI